MDELGFPFPGSFSSWNYGVGTDGIEEEGGVEGGRMAEIAEDGEEAAVVHVAVGKSIEKSVDLLHWTFRRFGKSSVVLLHVHQPSSTVPTPLGRLPAAQANEKLLSVYRREERKESMNLLSNYLNICFRAKVKASVIAIEDVQVQKGIVELVNMHGIRKLVMGAAPFNCMKVRKSSSKAKYASKRAPPFCEILFVNKGKHVWTREASEGSSILPQMLAMPETTKADILRLKSSHNYENEHFCPIAGFSSHPPIRLRASNGNWNMVEIDELEEALSIAAPSSNSFSSESACYSIGSTEPSELDLKVEEESLHNQILDMRAEAETLKNEAFAELLKRRRLESEALVAINRMKTFEAAHSREVNHRKEVEDRLAITRREQENLLEQKEQISKKLQRAMRNVAFLDIRAREAMRRQNEAARELGLIQTSLATLRHEKQNINRQKEEATQQLEWWKSQWQTGPPNGSCYTSVDPLAKLTEYSLSELQAATCNFSESFKIGQGEHGCVYKGEILDRSVVIKKLHPPNMQGILEFQQEVQRLSKLQHPHLVSLIGACPEALSLVFDYMPNGSIQDHLFSRTNRDPLTWKTRTRIAAEISSALLYLHSYNPEKIVHGNLKPENILLDSESKCKLGDVGIFRLIPEETARCPSFRGTSETKSAFPYTDPEVQRSRHLRPESDIYSFGVIILQLLTGRPPFGLASEVRQALLGGNLASMLDPTAGDWPMFVATRLVELGLQFCEVNGRDRPMLTPTMVRELEQLHSAEERPVPSFFLCPILQEIMYDPHLAADGFTYEGEALRGWLKNGRETSPMTNLKLSHLHLTPNHALRLAIQDWLCQS